MKASLLWLPSLVVVGTACSDRMEATYSSMDEARAAGAVERGWVPSFLPGSTSRIREIHDLDTNEVWLRFEYAPEDHDAMVGQLRAASARSQEWESLRDPGVAWWDHDRLMRLAEDTETAEIYQTAGMRGFVLLLTGRAEGYLWMY